MFGLFELFVVLAAIPAYALLILLVEYPVRWIDRNPTEGRGHIDDWSGPKESAGEAPPAPAVAASPAFDAEEIPVAAVALPVADPLPKSEWSQEYYEAPGQEVEMSYANLGSSGYPKFGYFKSLGLSAATLVSFFIVGLLLSFFFMAIQAAMSNFQTVPDVVWLLAAFLLFNLNGVVVRTTILRGNLGLTVIALLIESLTLSGLIASFVLSRPG